ncbi:MAG: cysteine peptidase family C39 domain-containing protein [Dehalococcoidia bacterium]
MKLPLLIRKLICTFQGTKWLSDDDVVFQEGFDDCGEACLRMTLRFFELPGELRKEAVRFRPNGLSLLDITDALKDFELETIGFQFSSLDELKKILAQDNKIAPLIVLKGFHIPHVYTGLGHLVMLVGLTDQYAELKDPSLGHIRLFKERLNKKWTGKCLLVYSKETAEKCPKHFSSRLKG